MIDGSSFSCWCRSPSLTLFSWIQIFGMDLSSALAVHILAPQPGEHVLDLCCAPGP